MEASRLLPRSHAGRAVLAGVAIVALQLLPASAEGPTTEPGLARYEEQVLVDMIDRHVLAGVMAETCREKAVHEALVELCSSVVANRGEEIARMQSWLDEWYGVSYAPGVPQPAEKREAMLERRRGDEFEASLLDMMIVHGEEAVDEASACLERIQQPEMQMLCSGIAAEQAAEVEAMHDWLCRWHDVGCDRDW